MISVDEALFAIRPVLLTFAASSNSSPNLFSSSSSSGYFAFDSQTEKSDLEPTADTLMQNRASESTHASFRIIEPKHVFPHLENEGGKFTELERLPDTRSAWIDNGFSDSTETAAIDNPWTVFDGRDDWQEDGPQGARMIGLGRRLESAGESEADNLQVRSADGFLPSIDFNFEFGFGLSREGSKSWHQ